MYPKKAQIEVTNHCNLKCEGCLREKMTREKGYMTVNTFLKAISLCIDFGIEEIHLHHWGEPLLHPKIINCIEIAKSLDFKVGFTTNGTLLTHDILRKLWNCNLDKLDISYNKSSKDKRHLKNLYFASRSFGIDTWFRSVVFSKEEYDSLRGELKGYNVRFQRGMYFDFNRKRDKACTAIEKIFIINWDGTITPCCSMYDNQYIYGKIKNITVDALKLQMRILKRRIEEKSPWLGDCCNHCFEVDSELPLSFKL